MLFCNILLQVMNKNYKNTFWTLLFSALARKLIWAILSYALNTKTMPEPAAKKQAYLNKWRNSMVTCMPGQSVITHVKDNMRVEGL